MTLAEYYNLPEGTNATLKPPSFYDTVDRYPYPCSPIMSSALSDYGGAVVPELDVSMVTTMNSMFYNCKNLVSFKSIENWDVSNVTNMDNLFNYCSKLYSLDLSKWDTSKVTSMNNMFYNSSIRKLSAIRADKLSISTYNSPFGSSNLSSLKEWGGFTNLKSSWNGSYCVDRLTGLSHQSLINILNGLYDFTGNAVTPSSSQGKIKFGTTHLAKLTDEEKSIATNKGWTLS